MWKVANFMTDENKFFFRGILLNGNPSYFVLFRGGLPKKGAQFFLGSFTSIETMVW